MGCYIVAAESIDIRCNAVGQAAWDDYVSRHSKACNYHRYSWRTVVEKSFGHTCYYLSAHNQDGTLTGLLPLVYMQSKLFGNFLVSLPFFNYGGLLCNTPEIGEQLQAKAAALRQKNGAEYVELRHIAPWPGDLATKQHKVTMLLELPENADTLWKGFNAKLRNQIRKAEKSGCTATIGGSELLNDFYTVFVRNMRDLGTPVYGKRFFTEVLRAFPDDSRIITVYLEGKPVAAGVLNRFRDTYEIPWASSIRDYNSLCPNNLLYWTALQHALASGCTYFDFGRSTPDEGTYKFKEQWGAKPVALHWQYLLPQGASLPELNTKNPKFELAIKTWQKLPLSITRVLGPMIVKNIP
jgi:FemAB-related protein (PEP-CTERM system-associated)